MHENQKGGTSAHLGERVCVLACVRVWVGRWVRAQLNINWSVHKVIIK